MEHQAQGSAMDGAAGASALRMSGAHPGVSYAGYTSGAPSNPSSILAAQQAAWGSGVRGDTGQRTNYMQFQGGQRMSGGAAHGMNYTGGGTIQSSICIEVDEFKFYNIVRNVLFKLEVAGYDQEAEEDD